MITVLDVENTVTKRDGKLHLDPFEPSNRLVMVGTLVDLCVENIHTFYHSEVEPDDFGHTALQTTLDNTEVLVCHNASHDLVWLWETGFKYEGKVWDTMLTEYVLQRGVKEPLSLEACAERYNLNTMKQDTLKEYMKKGVAISDIPHNELKTYLSADLGATKELYEEQYSRLLNEDKKLRNTVDLTNEVAILLSRMYCNGFTVDREALQSVIEEFEKERAELIESISSTVADLMGDTPINLNSPEQLGWVIYSRKVLDKNHWSDSIDPSMSQQDFKELINVATEPLYKTKAVQCPTCKGKGHVYRIRKNGTPFAKPNKCTSCDSRGFLLNKTNERAGLKFMPRSPKFMSANGFSTSKLILEQLETVARAKNRTVAMEFLSKIKRLSAVETYLSSFVEGIRIHTKPDNKLHVRLLQHRTATGRFSGADPNMQNMPRGGTFPVKKVFVSRWEGGQIMEADFAQLEFRAAAFLSQDEVAIDEVKNGFDVHSYTAKIITDAGQPTSRQEAKAHTFAPLYGATGYGRTPAEAAYYEHFTEKYKGIGLWHSRLAKEALSTGMITTPSGRQFSFPDVTRRMNGSVTHFTQIKNYPVQSFATADIVPLALLYIYNNLANLRSCVVNTVHDSIVIDIHPEEVSQCIDVINKTNDKLSTLIEDRWGVTFNVPLLLEAKIGPNWLDTKDIS